MPRHGNAIPAQYPEFAGLVQHKLWPATKGRMSGDDLKGFIENPQEVMRRLRRAFSDEGAMPAPLVTASPFFANEEVESSYGYPQKYAVKPVEWQAELLTRSFQDNLGIRLDARETIAYARDLPDLSSFVPETWAGRAIRRWVNWYVVPRSEKIAETGNEAVEKVLDLVGKTRTFHNYRKGAFGPKYLRLSERTAVALQMIGEKQKGDFLLIPAQFGLTHRGRSVRRVRVVYAPHEFGLGSFLAGCMILSHPERLVQWEQLHIDCPGDEYSPDAGGGFSRAPIFNFSGGRVEFLAGWVSHANERFGSASGFVSQ